MVETAPRRALAVILAAGEGKRMQSALPKALHPIASRPMLGHVLASATQAGVDAVAVVVGPGREDVIRYVETTAPAALVVTQTERRGTAHAVLAASDAIRDGFDEVLILYADAPLVQPDTLRRMRTAVAEGARVAVLGFEARRPEGYGRLLLDGAGTLAAIREDKDATEAERSVTLCNSGLIALQGRGAIDLLGRIGSDNAQGEFYLTDCVEIARRDGDRCVVLLADEAEVMGVNDRVQLAAAEAALQQRLRREAMLAGATLQAPETVFLSADTRLGRDVTVEPHVVFGPGVVAGDTVVIHSFSHLEQVQIERGASIGPFARLRPGTKLGEGSRVGNFVEIKNATIEAGAKINHLSYIGDASVGAKANIGAGTITCNYDGFNKARTEIGAGAFIGSNSALVAPVSIGRGAFVGSGSVITEPVPDDALALGRGRQVNKDGWATDFRERQTKGR